jgi:hypothetical protein
MPPNNILDPYFVEIFPHIPPDQQCIGVDTLKAKCAEIEGAGSTDAQLAMMGHSDVVDLPEDKRKAIVAGGLDQMYWQLARFLRVSNYTDFEHSPPPQFKVLTSDVLQYSTPSRIEEATPYLKLILAHFAIEKPGEIDTIPLMYLGVALHKIPGEEAAALNAFTAALDHGDGGSTNNTLWARGCMSRLLRRMGQPQAAEGQEAEIRSEPPML